MLESCWGVSKAEVHNQKIKGAVVRLEGGLPFITRHNADKVVCATEIDLGEDGGFTKAV